MFFDERFNFIPEGSTSERVLAISEMTDPHNPEPLDIIAAKAPKNGYAYIYVSNESDEHVYFDNLQVTHLRGRIIEENHYYAYGLKIASLSSKKLGYLAEGSLKNNYLYQGNYAEYDEDIGWHDFALRSYDAQLGRFWQTDPYDEFASGYTGMGNDPVNMVDPSGGWAATGIFEGMSQAGIIATTTLAGAIVGSIVDKLSGGDGWNGAAIGAGVGLGSNFASGIVNQLGNLGTHLPAVAGNILNVLNRPTVSAPNPSTPNTPPNSLIRVYIKHGKKKADGGDNSWDKWDGHTLLQIDNTIYHFYPTKYRGTKDLEPNGYDDKADMKETWYSNGEVGTMDINDQGTKDYFSARENAKFGFSVFEFSITPAQKTSLLSNINKSIANPPDYMTLGTRCQSWVSRMLRNATVLPNSMGSYSWSTVPFSKALFRKFPGKLIYKTFSTKVP